jgi:6,7-dimethyl-8-ribityllumazine synthase
MADKPKFLIVEARFYEDLADELALGAEEAFAALGVESEKLTVPGALEIPAAIAFAAAAVEEGTHGYCGYVALGCVIRGETSHYDYVCGESARGLQTLALEGGLCIGNGILTVENGDQAWARAARDQKNKGKDAAEAAHRMWEIRNQFETV